jgi:tetratricopeptide (TPR) repeat protein
MRGQAVIGPPISVFYSYAHEDEALRDELEKHLNLLQRQGIIQAWHDRNITGGSAWEDQVDQHLEAAQLILLLISPDFLHSDYCYGTEMKRALARHAKGEAWVLPIHLRPVDWEGAAFTSLQALPTDARPVTAWRNRDQAFKNIAQGIRKATQEIRQTTPGAPIAHTILAAPGRGRRSRLGAAFLLVACVLLIAAGLGWYTYTQHAAPIAQYLADGERFLATGQYAQAKEAYQQALAQSWFDTRAARLGLEKAGIYDSPDGQFRPIVIQQRIGRIMAQNPGDAHAYLFQGDLHAISEAYDRARDFYEKAIVQDPTLAHAYFKLGVTYDKSGERDKALAMYEQAVEHAPWHQTYLNNLAYQYFRQKHYDKAIATYRRALALNADFLITYFDMANYYRALGQPQEALRYQQKGVSLIEDPQVTAAEINREAWYFSVGDQHFYLDTPPQKQCYAYRSLAATLRELQRQAEADRYQQKPCQLDGADERAIQEWVEVETQHMGGAPRAPSL